MARADYNHSITEEQGEKVITIIDLNLGNTSVTNDIENVVEEIAQAHDIEPNDYMIIYRDSDLRWDGWDAKTESYVPLNATTKFNAIENYQAWKKKLKTSGWV
jgi:hypothetical protein